MYLEAKARPYPLGDLPLIVLAGVKAEGPPPGSSAAEWQRLVDEKRREKAEQAHLSRNSQFILDPESGHHIQIDHPALVVDAIRRVVAAARHHTPLARLALGLYARADAEETQPALTHRVLRPATLSRRHRSHSGYGQEPDG